MTMCLARLILLLTTCRLILCEEMMPREILEAPETQVASQKFETVSFSCRIRGEDFEWLINGELSSTVRNERLIQLGVVFVKTPRSADAEINATITFPNKHNFNNTAVICVSLNASGTLESPVATLIIAGGPLPPIPELNVINRTVLNVSWTEPFTWSNFPILTYNLTIFNTTSHSSESFYLASNDTFQLITRDTETTVCSELIFQLSADNGEGWSEMRSVSGGFPVVPQKFPSEPSAVVKFSPDGTPDVLLTFPVPETCSFHEAYYQVEIFKEESDQLVEKGDRVLIDNSKMIEYEISLPLEAFTSYCAKFTFYFETFDVESSPLITQVKFSTAFHPTIPGTTNDSEPTTHGNNETEPGSLSATKSGQRPWAIIGSAVGGSLTIILILIVIIVIVILLMKQRVEGNAGQQQKRNSMVDNPLYEGPIYEIISENKKRKHLCPKAKVHAEESVYLDSPTQSMPRECVPSYSNGAIVMANSMTDSKLQDHTALKLESVETSLDHHPLQSNPYANTTTTTDQVCEDAYTLMCPARPAAHSSVSTCHTNYMVTGNDDSTISGRYVVDVRSPYTSGASQKQVTLV